MKRLSLSFWIVILMVSLWSCSTKKEMVTDMVYADEGLAGRLLDSVDVYPSDDEEYAEDISEPKVYQPSATMTYDIINTKLDLKFDWAKRYVLGKATLQLKPYFKPIDSLSLDAVGFDIHEVKLNNRPIQYKYDGNQMTVYLPKTFTRRDTFVVFIDYTAKPDENSISGSEAISSNKGLFFINPDSSDPDMPRQIWTQGESQNNSRWFPTFDRPNERFSQEITLTVDDKYKTLSNGLLVSSVKHADGTRTDHWKQDKPHAPYLVMLAVGDFHEDIDTWNGIKLHYMVDKNYSKYAKQIFNNTPEMLSFFSEKLQYPYPWDKYAQIAVKEYVSGAMENTGAVVFGDFVEKTARELIDNDNDLIVAHEMFHHWFGDLVTCEDWSNLTLNEGFANYAEYMWYEHKYGKDRADFHLLQEAGNFFRAVTGGNLRPLINYYYTDREKMFDVHSYSKGGLVLHMLRAYAGDDAFFAALNKYLTDNAYSAVEIDELRMAFEDTMGEDLHWFFDQWYHSEGYPIIEAEFAYDTLAQTMKIELSQEGSEQTFDMKFNLPFEVALYDADGAVTYHPIRLTEGRQTFYIRGLKNIPVTFELDGKNAVLAIITDNKTEEQEKELFLKSGHLRDRISAFSSLGENTASVLDAALNDDFYYIRQMAINSIPEEKMGQYIDILQNMVLTDKHADVRMEALVKLAEYADYDVLPLCKIVVNSEPAYPALEVALSILGDAEPEMRSHYFNQYKNDDSNALTALMVTFMEDATPEHMDYLETKAKTISGEHIFNFYQAYGQFMSDKDLKTVERAVDFNSQLIKLQPGNMYKMYAVMIFLNQLKQNLAARDQTDEVKMLIDKIDGILAGLF